MLPIPVSRYTLYGLMGNAEKEVTVKKSGLPLTLADDVQFVVPSK